MKQGAGRMQIRVNDTNHSSLFNSCLQVNGGTERTRLYALLGLYVSIYTSLLLQTKPELL